MQTNTDWPGGVDALSPDALGDLDLPPATKRQLQAGLPREVRLPGWLGPTLFSSELGSGRVPMAASLGLPLGDHVLAQAFVIGTVREIQGAPAVYAAFCLQPNSSDLWLVDIGEPHMVRFVNSGLDEFLRSVRGFVNAWTRARSVPAANAPVVARELRHELTTIDARAFADEDSYWPTWLETEFLQP